MEQLAAAIINEVEFSRTFLRIQDKEARTIPLVMNGPQGRYLKGSTQRDIILKARQMGFSTAIQARIFHRAVTRTFRAATISHEQKTTDRFRRMVQLFHKYFPGDIRPLRELDNAVVATYPDFDSECIIATAGNLDTGRGGTYDYVHASEVAFWNDPKFILAGLMQGGNPQIVVESTPNGAAGWFYQTVKEAQDGSPYWKLHFFEWWHDPGYAMPLADGESIEYDSVEAALAQRHKLSPEQIKWRRLKIIELKDLFPQEYPEDIDECFLASGNGYFGNLPPQLFLAPTGGDQFYAAPYKEDHAYVAGIDFGQNNDFTVVVIIDRTARCMAAMLRINRTSWQEIRRLARAIIQQFHCNIVLAEANSIGGPNIETLNNELGGDPCAITPIYTTTDSKREYMADLYDALHAEKEPLILQDVPGVKRELRSFVAVQTAAGNWQLKAQEKEHDDIVIALALANKARVYRGAISDIW